MMVIKIKYTRTSGTNAFSPVLGYTLGTTVGDTVEFIVPADRASWVQSDDSAGGYDVGTVRVFDGVTDNGEAVVGRTTSGQVITVTTKLGFIGKSGRFVEIA